MKLNEVDLVSWMREEALPLWVSRGVDRQAGGFVEELSQDGSPSMVQFKRVRVQGRQLFCFATAAILGWHKDAGSLAEIGFNFLKKNCRAGDGHWVRRLSRDGAILDSEFDLYDTAFVVLGFAVYYRLTKNREALELMGNTLEMVRSKLGTASKTGYRQSPGEIDVLRQNPNMHWFEAMIFCYEATGEQRFLEEAAGIYRVIEGSVMDPKTGALREIFDSHWKPVQEGGKILVEPGHHYEWSWLLSRAADKISINPAVASGLLGFADRFGVNSSTGLVYDQVSDRGEITQSTHRLWVQTEALKAWLVRTDVTDSDREKRIQQIEANLTRRYLTRDPKGSWCDRLDEDGRVHDGPVPASSMYHIMMCVVELWSWRGKK